MPKGENSSAGGDAMKRLGPSPDLGPANPHEIQGVSHNYYATVVPLRAWRAARGAA
jgi:hypothetical protein